MVSLFSLTGALENIAALKVSKLQVTDRIFANQVSRDANVTDYSLRFKCC